MSGFLLWAACTLLLALFLWATPIVITEAAVLGLAQYEERSFAPAGGKA
ncbi:MAG TPA: hypothetical protein VH640_27745 [Bryobacteraceae bacterium]|jgi:hypothetical protein